jgi:integrase
MDETKTITLKDGRAYTLRANRDRFFYPNEWMDFFDELKPSQKMTFDFLLSTGARINEARHVQIGDIDIGNRRIILRVTKIKAKKGERNPRPRTIPISSQFAKRLKKATDKGSNDNYIRILSTPAANIAMKKGLQKAGIKDWYMFSVHNIRKTLEIWLMALGVDSLKLTAHIGHDIKTAAQHYVSPDIFSWEEKKRMRDIIGDLYER